MDNNPTLILNNENSVIEYINKSIEYHRLTGEHRNNNETDYRLKESLKMKYTQPQNMGRNIIHKFTKEGEHYIGGKKWNQLDMSFTELRKRTKGRSFMFTIKYSNPPYNEYQLNQFTMDEDEIIQFLEIVNNTVNNQPVFKQPYNIGDKFIIPEVSVINTENNYKKETIYKNVEAKLTDIYRSNNKPYLPDYYTLSFDNNSIRVLINYIENLQRIN